MERRFALSGYSESTVRIYRCYIKGYEQVMKTWSYSKVTSYLNLLCRNGYSRKYISGVLSAFRTYTWLQDISLYEELKDLQVV